MANITGLTSVAPELSVKRLELLKEVVPKATRVAVLFNPGNIGFAPRLKEMELASRELGMKLQPTEIRRDDYFEEVFEAVKKDGVHALIVFRAALVTVNRDRIVKLAAEKRLPAIYEQRDYVQAGGLMSYDPSQLDISSRAAYYVDRIIKGAQPAALPVEQPTKFELVINLKTAKQIGLSIPPNVLARADKVIR